MAEMPARIEGPVAGPVVGPLAVATAFVEAWNRHDMADLASLFSADAQFVNIVGIWWKGAHEIKAAHEATHRAMFRESRLDVLRSDVRRPSADVALVRMHWRLSGHRGPDNESLPARTGYLLHVLHRTVNGWRIIDTQNTDIIEGALSRPQPDA